MAQEVGNTGHQPVVNYDSTAGGYRPEILVTASPATSAAHRTVTALDGAYPPLPTDSSWAANPGGSKTARFLTDLVIRATTALADDPVLALRPYIRHGGSSGYVAAGEAVYLQRPRLKDLSSIKAQLTTDNEGSFTNSSANVIDNSAATGLVLNSLDVAANGDYFYIGGPVPFCGCALDMGDLNANASVLTGYYWNGSAWTILDNLTDGTTTGGATLGVDGQVTWDVPATWATKAINSITAYYIRFQVSAALDASTEIEEVDLLMPIKAAVDVQADGDDVTLMVEGVSGGTGTLAYSGTTRVTWR